MRVATCAAVLVGLAFEQHQELVAADARHHVAGAQHRRRSPTCRSTASPLLWPNVSLTGLKPSRSMNSTARRAFALVGARDRGEQLVLEDEPVRQAGQRIVVRDLLQVGVGLAQRALEAIGAVDQVALDARHEARDRQRQCRADRAEQGRVRRRQAHRTSRAPDATSPPTASTSTAISAAPTATEPTGRVPDRQAAAALRWRE